MQVGLHQDAISPHNLLAELQRKICALLFLIAYQRDIHALRIGLMTTSVGRIDKKYRAFPDTTDKRVMIFQRTGDLERLSAMCLRRIRAHLISNLIHRHSITQLVESNSSNFDGSGFSSRTISIPHYVNGPFGPSQNGCQVSANLLATSLGGSMAMPAPSYQLAIQARKLPLPRNFVIQLTSNLLYEPEPAVNKLVE
ncbi:unnamed protein product [Protopolystoma xenopodis]|uniref:Uncharacterized protein n=1 Tax=Protopolystoma xenopodis TaxID=117903 RepID=A0A448WKW7_9PLAT|nr:unnamed protein product [Protopolystoma xenopodis]